MPNFSHHIGGRHARLSMRLSLFPRPFLHPSRLLKGNRAEPDCGHNSVRTAAVVGVDRQINAIRKHTAKRTCELRSCRF
jgi:hypothetical protein